MAPSGRELPDVRVRPPGPESQKWLHRHARVNAPMGPRLAGAPGSIVLSRGQGANVWDADGNRYVDLAAGFGALSLGHGAPEIAEALQQGSERLFQALGDVYPSDSKIELGERLTALYPTDARCILAQSGSDAVAAAMKTAALHTGRPGVAAFSGAYHGLGYGPLAACGLRPSYREPFAAQLNPYVRFFSYPDTALELDVLLPKLREAFAEEPFGCVLVEPILGRGGVVVPPARFLRELAAIAHGAGALLIVDEIWTGMGRSGALLASASSGVADLVCIGKGLGGGVPISAVIGRADVMQSWSRDAEVVHTATFAGAPLACAAAIATLDVLARDGLAERSKTVGERLRTAISAVAGASPGRVVVRGEGLMIGIDLGGRSGAGALLQRKLLERGFVTSTGGGQRECLVLTPPLNIAEELLEAFVPELVAALGEVS